jgi:hypothetical protein
MQMALDALETRGEHHPRVYEAIKALRDRLAQPEPEPVAQCSYPKCQATNGCVGACSKTAPPKREWVGLTEADIYDAMDNEDEFDFAEAIEAKLKEKNG